MALDEVITLYQPVKTVYQLVSILCLVEMEDFFFFRLD